MSDASQKQLSVLLLSLVCITAAVAAWRIIPTGPGVPWQLSPSPLLQSAVKTAYYALPALLFCVVAAYALTGKQRERLVASPVSLLCIILLGVAVISLIVNPVAHIFQSRLRLVSIALVMVLAGPLLYTHQLVAVRKTLLQYLCVGCIAVSALYAIAILFYLTHYTSYLSRYQYVWDWLNVASVPCGMAAALGVLFTWTRLCRQTTTCKSVTVAAMALCYWVMIMASSRAAIAGLAIALTVLLLLPATRHKDYTPVWLRWLTIAMIAFMSVAVFRPLTEIMETKYWKITDTPDANFFSSREEIWEARSQEAESHWVFGIGFATVESNPGTLNPDGTVPTDGRVEPGSGWLYLLSSCGIFALIAFAAIYLWSLKRAAKGVVSPGDVSPPDALLLLGMTLLFGVHLCTEGYMLAAGSPFCIMLWLTLGLAHTPSTKRLLP